MNYLITLIALLIFNVAIGQPTAYQAPDKSPRRTLPDTIGKRNEPIYVEATLMARIGLADSLMMNLLANAANARKEKGCLSYEVYRNLNDRNIFVLFEKWTNQASINQHIEMPYIKRWFSIRNRYIGNGTLNLLAKLPD